MILNDPYQFRGLKLSDTRDTVLNIGKYAIVDYTYIKQKELSKIKPFVNQEITLNPIMLYGLSDIEKEIPTFHHSLVNVGQKWIAMDMRPYVTKNETGEGYSFKNQAEYQVALYRFVLSGIWYSGKQSSVYSLTLGHFAFGTWLADNLTKKFGLDLADQIRLKVLSLIYYSTMFTNTFTNEDLVKLSIRCRGEIASESLFEDVYKSIDRLENIEDFCRNCYLVTENVRLKGLDFSVLANLLANNWPGNIGKELSLLSLEHPPTWLSLVYASLTNRSYKRSFIASVVDKHDKRGSGEDFIKNSQAIMAENMD